MIYLDCNATTPLDERVLEAMQRCARQIVGNPASQHAAGRQARRTLEEARRRIGHLLGAAVETADADQVILTSGGTESNNLALSGLTRPGGRIVVSAIEHPSVLEAARALTAAGRSLEVVAPDRSGLVPVEAWQPWLVPPTQLVSLMLANNETGILQPVAALAELAARQGIPVHTDAVQAAGKIAVHFRQLGVTSMSVAAHKLHGPVGIGALIVRHGVPVTAILHGGVQQRQIRPGTESVILAVGFCRALELWHLEAEQRADRMRRLRDYFEQQILSALPEAVVIGADQDRVPHTSLIAFPGCDRQALFLALDSRGVACSVGSACASGSSEPSPVLRAMKVPDSWLHSALRFSLGAMTSQAEIEEAARRVVDAVRHVRQVTAGFASTVSTVP